MRTDEKLELICDTISTNCGDIFAAAKSNGVSTHFITQWMKDDKIARDRINEAQRIGWMGLESEAIRRGVHGVEEDVWYKGEIKGSKTVYSDGLLGKLLEARNPAFKKGEAGGTTFNGPTQVNIMPRAASYDEWLAMKDATMNEAARAALPAPDTSVPDILTGDYVDVEDELAELYPLANLKGLGL